MAYTSEGVLRPIAQKYIYQIFHEFIWTIAFIYNKNIDMLIYYNHETVEQ